jgi:Na+/H+-dicarboxylate symporter
MRNTLKLLLALIIALCLGLIASSSKNVVLLALVNYLEPIGLLWIGFLKMVVIPLLISLLITSVASKDKRKRSPLLRKTIGVFVLSYVIVLLVSFMVVPLLLQLVPATLALDTHGSDASTIINKPIHLQTSY